jgi:hypothetical protein
MRETILKNWTFFRVLRLLIGFAIIVQAVLSKDLLIGAAGLFFTAMAVFNRSCCGAAGCITPTKTTVKNSKDISYEEVV